MLSTFWRSVTSKVYEAFDRLKSHTPLPCPGTQSINITLKFHYVFFILNFTIANTVISKRSYFQTQYLMRCHLCTKRTTRGQERCPGGHPQNRSPVRFYSIYNSSLLSEAKERIYPFHCFATDSIAKQFAFKEFMRGCIKCLFKIQYKCVNLSSVVQDFSPIIYYRSQLSFTTMSFPECMLPIWQVIIVDTCTGVRQRLGPFYCMTRFYMNRRTTKPTKWPLHPAKTQISLDIRPVWSESSLSAWRNIWSSAIRCDGRYPGWSESSLGAQVILFVCSAAAHM